MRFHEAMKPTFFFHELSLWGSPDLFFFFIVGAALQDLACFFIPFCEIADQNLGRGGGLHRLGVHYPFATSLTKIGAGGGSYRPGFHSSTHSELKKMSSTNSK